MPAPSISLSLSPIQDETLPPTWEPPSNLADNLLRDYEDRGWRAAREGDAPALRALLAGGPLVLSNVVDEARRSALHYAAGTGSAECVELLCRAGAALDLTDKEGENERGRDGWKDPSPARAWWPGLLFPRARPSSGRRCGRSLPAVSERLQRL